MQNLNDFNDAIVNKVSIQYFEILKLGYVIVAHIQNETSDIPI